MKNQKMKSKCQNPNVKSNPNDSMSKEYILSIWILDFELDLTFDIWILDFGF
ncbi:hypothetical protein KJ616_01680 [Patescibacteria group bacterium]|nr:hypothetical protein [Patescibacteria group bacterium]